MKHSRIAPSALAITVACPGSLTLQERVPTPPETDEEAEGTAAHIVATAMVRPDPFNFPDGVKLGWTFRTREPERLWTIDHDMIAGARLFADACGGPGNIESPVAIPRIHPECWGTPDFWSYDSARKYLRVVDYKYGHRYVDPFENLQLVAYASGILSQLGISTGDTEVTVELIIVQPRAYHRDGPMQWWVTSPFGLNPTIVRARDAVASALGPNPQTSTGSQCKDCVARHACRTLQTNAAHIADFSGSAELDVIDVTNAAVELRILAEAAERLDARRTGLVAQIEAALRIGQRVPYWQLVPGRSKLAWTEGVTVDEVLGLGSVLGVDMRNRSINQALMTPTQAIAAGVPEAVVGAYAETRPGGMSLKPEGDARRVFGNS